MSMARDKSEFNEQLFVLHLRSKSAIASIAKSVIDCIATSRQPAAGSLGVRPREAAGGSRRPREVAASGRAARAAAHAPSPTTSASDLSSHCQGYRTR